MTHLHSSSHHPLTNSIVLTNVTGMSICLDRMLAFPSASLMWKVMAGICLVYIKTRSRIGVGVRRQAFQYHIIFTYQIKPFHVRRISPLSLYVDHSPLLPYAFHIASPFPLNIHSSSGPFPSLSEICWATGCNTISFVCFVICLIFRGRLFHSRYHLRISLSINYLSSTFLSYTTSTVPLSRSL